MKDQALRYHEAGLQPIPIRPGQKKPMIEWKIYQTQRITVEDIERWWGENPTAGIALLTGPGIDGRPGILVLDIDKPDNNWPEDPDQKASLMGAAIQQTGGGGKQYFFKWDERLAGVRTTRAKIAHNVDLRGEGGYVLVPPSGHPSGGVYEWLVPLIDVEDLPHQPEWLLDIIRQFAVTKSEGGKGDEITEILSGGVSEGGRNDAAARIAGMFWGRGLKRDTVEILMQDWNAKNKPPMHDDELQKTIDSIGQAEMLNAGNLPDIAREDMNDEQRAMRIKAISDKFKIELAKIEYLEGDDGYFKFYIGQRVAEVTGKEMHAFRPWCASVTAAAHRVPKKPPPAKEETGEKGWELWANMMMESAILIDPGEEATIHGQIKLWIRGYIGRGVLLNGQQPTVESPIYHNGKIIINPEDFKRYCATAGGFKLNTMRLSQRIKELNIAKKRVRVRAATGKEKNAYFYIIEPELWPDDFKPEQLS